MICNIYLAVRSTTFRDRRRRGEADSARLPLDILPAERVYQGRQTLALQAQRDCEVLQAAVEHTWTYLMRVLKRRTPHRLPEFALNSRTLVKEMQP